MENKSMLTGVESAEKNRLSIVGDEELLTAPAHHLLSELNNRRVSAEELLALQMQRTERINPQLNAVVAQNIDSARQAAREIDNARANRRSVGPLAGLPMTIKDSFEVAGMTATCGLTSLAEHRPQSDAVTVSLLRQAGAVIYGKTNVPQACGDHQSYNDVFGATMNPWNSACTPGGSSGGSAAALAAGLTSLELGSDIGGSIRCPAHFCGVFGHKSSYGLLPSTGHIPAPADPLKPAELTVIGPMARDPKDLSLMMDVLLGGEEKKSPASALTRERHQRLDQYRVGVWLDAYPLDDEYRNCIVKFADDLTKIGVYVDYNARPDVDPALVADLYLETLFGVIGSRMTPKVLDQFLRQVDQAKEQPYASKLARFVQEQQHLSGRVMVQRQQLMERWQAFFKRYDVLICPVVPTLAFPHDSAGHGPAAQLSRTLSVNQQSQPYLNNLLWPGMVSVANLPATAMPTGYFSRGLPAGVQVIGPYMEDRTTLRFAELVVQHITQPVFPEFLTRPASDAILKECI